MNNTPDGILCSFHGGYSILDGAIDVTFIRYHIEDRALENKVLTKVLHPIIILSYLDGFAGERVYKLYSDVNRFSVRMYIYSMKRGTSGESPFFEPRSFLNQDAIQYLFWESQWLLLDSR